jgi:hypothetical protein
MSTFKWANSGSAVSFEGTIDEYAQLPSAAEVGANATIDTSGVRRINSLGVRKWIQFIASLNDVPVTLVRCSPPIVEQLNCIRGFRGHATVKSVMLSYACDNCSRVNYVELEIGKNAIDSVPPTARCEQCGGDCEFDDLPERYLGFTR